MLIFVNAGLIVYSVPKTGTTSIDSAIGSKAEIRLRGTKARGLKHISARRFIKWDKALKKEFPNQKFVSCCVMREPIDWLASWFRYRTRDEIKKTKRYTGDMSFDDYLLKLCDKNEVGKRNEISLNGQSKFLISKNRIGIDRIFPYEKIDNFINFLSERLNRTIELPKQNISPELSKSKLEISSETLERIKPFISLDINIYNQILKMESYDSSKENHKSILNRVINQS